MYIFNRSFSSIINVDFRIIRSSLVVARQGHVFNPNMTVAFGLRFNTFGTETFQ